MKHEYLLWMHCLEPLHHGSGEGLGVVDRPLLRSIHNGHPIIQGSTVKGVVKAEATERAESATKAAPAENGVGTDSKAELEELFGKSGTEGYQGRANFHDFSVVFFPVRSLADTFVWVTSPLALHKLRDALPQNGDLCVALGMFLDAACSEVKPGFAVAPTKAGGILLGTGANARCCIENRVLQLASDQTARGLFDEFTSAFAAVIFKDSAYWQEFFKARVLLITDKDYTALMQTATEVRANIAMDKEGKGVTQTGSLRYTEYLPAETILWAPLSVWLKEAGLIRRLMSLHVLPVLQGVLQFGADETTGKGVTRMGCISVAQPAGEGE